jgi:Tfp pilus assembly protein PilO
MLDKGNIDILYILLALFIVYIFIIKAKETLEALENIDLTSKTEEELRLLINKGIRSAEKLVFLEQMSDKTDYIRKRIEELNQDLNNAKRAKETLAERGVVV